MNKEYRITTCEGKYRVERSLIGIDGFKSWKPVSYSMNLKEAKEVMAELDRQEKIWVPLEETE